MSKRRVSYFYDPDVGSYTYGLGHPMKPHRILMAHELISSYPPHLLLAHPSLTHLRPPRASAQQMTAFHTDEYVHFLSRVTPETMDELTGRGTQFLVGDDNPAFEGLWEFCTISAGGSLCAAKRINEGRSDIAINWAGGLHHAKKREASGFCYINDIVLAILDLLRVFPRVLYVDIDCHHGDGVEEAFYTTDRVMTCSFHKYGEYFPGTGTQEDGGRGKGRGYALNVPLKDGMSDETFKSVFDPVLERILAVFRPSAIILQCGADSLSGDKLGCFNLTMQGHAHCTSFLRTFDIPLILLGGGGYTVKNVARAWCYETACALGVQHDLVPEGEEGGMMPWNEYFEWFGPRYRLEVVKNNMEDVNLRIADPQDSEDVLDNPTPRIPIPRDTGRSWKQTEIARVRERALQQIKELEGRIGAPSVQMMDVPRESVAEHTGFFNGTQAGEQMEMEWQDELDVRLAQHSRFIYHLQSQSSSSYPNRRRRHPSPSSSQSSPSTSDEERDLSEDDRDSDSDNSHYSSALRSTRSTRSQARNILNNNSRGGSASRRSNQPSQPQPSTSSQSSSSVARKRMSMMTNMVFEVPLCAGDTNNTNTGIKAEQCVGSKDGKMGRRRFFFDTGISSGLGSVSGLRGNGIHGIDTLPSSRGASPFVAGGSSLSERSAREATEDLGDLGDGDEDTVMMDSRSGTPRGMPRGINQMEEEGEDSGEGMKIDQRR
ncbi:histone deacetylase [Lentinula aciculospora]|uniref:histone deacetylase n=1 Tax=Lentinula aciculospora TaxID=153920 RepID=A0A9W9AGB6_9AGAR|nr:histone deacetylase [Lentinula aciculospora]